LTQFTKHHHSENLKFNYVGIFQNLKLRIFTIKILLISLKLNFTPNTLGCYVKKRRKKGEKNFKLSKRSLKSFAEIVPCSCFKCRIKKSCKYPRKSVDRKENYFL